MRTKAPAAAECGRLRTVARLTVRTTCGILIPDTAKEKPTEGELIAVGPGARSADGKVQPLDVKVGDRVLFGKWSGTEIKVDGQDVVIMKESDIMGIFVRDAASTRKAA